VGSIRRRSLFVGILASGLLAGASLLPLGPLEVFELGARDLRFRLRERWRPVAGERRVRTVQFDDTSLAAFGHWPLPYAAFTEAVARLGAAGARVVGLDVLLAPADSSQPREARRYRELLLQLSRTPGTVVAVPAPVRGRDPASLDLARSVGRVGQALLVRDEDGIVRRVPLEIESQGVRHPSFVLQLICEHDGVAPADVDREPGAVVLRRAGRVVRRIPVDGDGCLLVDYHDRRRDAGRDLSLADVARGTADLGSLHGRVVLLGTTAARLGHFDSTPLGPRVADVHVHAEALETVLAGRYPMPARRATQFLVTWGFLLAGALLMMRLPPWRGVLLGLGLMALYVVYEKVWFIWGDVWFDFIGPMAAMQLGVVAFPLWSYRSRSQAWLDEMAGLRRFDDLILSTMTSGLLVADASGRVVKGNARAAHLLCRDQESLEGERLDEVLAASPEAVMAMQRALATLDTARGPACSLPLHVPFVVDTSGPEGYRLLDLSLSALDAGERSRPGRAGRHVLLTFTDVTERVRLAQEDERRARLAAIGEIAAKLGHEIRNSLGGLRLYVENVREEIDPQSAAGHAIDSMVEEIESLYRKIDELREYARDPQIEVTPCDLKQIVDEALAFASSKLREKHVQVVIEAEPRLEPVWVDRRQLRGAFQNLIHNAVEAAPDGGSLRIGIERAPSANGGAGTVLVHVEDDGPGIPEEHGQQIFSLFFTTKAEAGTGLGLPIVKKIVESHGGRVSYTSRPGCTRFTVALPPGRRGEGSA
jgi:signal transduction histidine kinase/CHASE2 domain-containing sensor protein